MAFISCSRDRLSYLPDEFHTSLEKMVSQIVGILSDRAPCIYLFGSVVLNDFKLGWSDIDIIVLTQKEISEKQAEELLLLRQRLLEQECENPYYLSFEGGILPMSSFINGSSGIVVYWGTSGQRITNRYHFDSFCMAQLLESGILIYGEDIRESFKMPSYDMLYADIKAHYDSICKYAKNTDRSFYSFGWFLDIARCLYTLQTGKLVSKTAAGEWALNEEICPVPATLETALKVRKSPLRFKGDSRILDYAETLGADVQLFADKLELALNKYKKQ